MLYGLRGNLFHSDDDGENWHPLTSETDAGLTSAVQLVDGTLLVAGLSGTLLIVNLTEHQVVTREEAERKGFSSLLATADGRILAVGDFGVTLLPPSLYRQPAHEIQP